MAANFRNIGEDQEWSTRGTEIMETNQQNYQTGNQSSIDRTSPSLNSIPGSSSTQSTNPLMEPKPQKPKESKKQDTSRVEKTTVTNLSSYNLSEAERNLLGRGLNFIPTPPREHPAKILQDHLLFDQKLRLRYYFEDKETKPQEQLNISILKWST